MSAPSRESARGGASIQTGGLRDRVGLACALAWLLGLALSVPCDAMAQKSTQHQSPLSVAETEMLVRQVYFEGMPEAEARRIGPDGAARLVEMLEDPAEAPSHPQILLALGISGQPGALEAIRAWADQPREGEIDRNTFRAWQVLPYALGHLARVEPDCLVELEAGLTAAPPGWTFRHHRGPRLQRQARRAAATALAMTGLPSARRALDRARRDSSDAGFEAHLERMRAFHSQRASERAR